MKNSKYKKRILNLIFIITVGVFLFLGMGLAEGTSNVLLVDSYNYGSSSVNDLGLWTGGGSSGTSTVEEVRLHYYDGGGVNNAKKFTYDCSGEQDYCWDASNLWDSPKYLDISDFDYLSFRVKGEAGSEDFYIELQYGAPIDGGPEPLIVIHSSDYFTTTDDWKQVNLPLTAFAGLDKTKMRAVVIKFWHDLSTNQGIIYLDNLQFSNGYGKPESTGSVRIDRETKTLFVNNEPYRIKGVGYEPVPIGGYPPIDDVNIYDRDLPLLVDMGCNTIRVWGMPGINILTKAEEYGLKVIAGFWMELTVNFSNPAVRNSTKQQFTTFVNTYKDSSALLVWAIGNENNYHNGSNSDYYSLANELAEIAYQIEGDSYHPVIIVNGHLYHMGNDERGAEDMQLNFIDAWGCNVYTRSFSALNWLESGKGFFEVYKERSAKPIIVTEYGADAFRTTDHDTLDGYEDQDMQADWVQDNILEIMAASDVCAGSTIMAYSDEWWKDPSGNPSTHDRGGWAGVGWNTYPDDYANEEYWGIVEIALDGTWETPPTDGLDDIKERKVYYMLKALFKDGIIVTRVVTPSELIQDAINTSSSGDIIYATDGTYEENVAINNKDNLTLMGDGTDDTIIEGNISFENSNSSIEKLSIRYGDGNTLTYSNDFYSDFKLLKNAGITAVDSEIVVKNCRIEPDPNIFTTNYGKGIQIWNLYGTDNVDLMIKDNLIQKAETGIYLYSHSFGGTINGLIQENDLYDNTYGIVLRMHKENPLIDGNTISNSTEDGIHITYEDGDLLTDRLGNISNNHFIGNTRNVFCDELGEERTPTGGGNIYE